MEKSDYLLQRLPPNHRRALKWFADNANTDQFWPKPLEDGLLLATKAKGIFKPAWTEYALSVRQVINSPYPDFDPISRDDGTWSYLYYQENDNPEQRDDAYTNRALMACWRDNVPVGVMRQISIKPTVRYRILGLAIVSGWEGGYFFFEGFSPDGYSRGKGPQAQIEILTSDSQLINSSTAIFNPDDVIDGRRKTLASVVQRQGQPAFRQALLIAYQGKCAISGCNVVEALEAAHITPFRGVYTNDISNGLLLRADLHTLFDLGLVSVNTQNMSVIISPKLLCTPYEEFSGKFLHLPSDTSQHPSGAAMDQHRAWAGL